MKAKIVRYILIPGAIAALTTTMGMLPVSASAPRSTAVSPIRHVVVLFLENHSFDSLLGYWCDDNPGRCPDGGMPASVRLSDGAVVKPQVFADRVPEVEHNTPSQLAAMNIRHGVPRMNGWQNIVGPQGDCSAALHYPCIGGYTPSQIPNLTTLATGFAISDRTFSVADSTSWAGHMTMVAATTDGFEGDNPHRPPHVTGPVGWGCDSPDLAPWGPHAIMVPSCVPDPSLNPARYPNGGASGPTPVSYVPTIMDRLNAAGLSWKIYGGSTLRSAGFGTWNICPSFAQCLDTSQIRDLVADSQFVKDAGDGGLPNFSVVTPGGADITDAGHNGMSMTACDDWIGNLVQAVESGPDWNSTAIFITFDDFGGFYDQVPPPVEPDGTREGPRMPLVIVSPWVRHGYTDTVATTFAGILAFTEQTFHLRALNVNDANAYPFARAFDYSQIPLRPVRMVSRPLSAWARHLAAHPPEALLRDPT